MRAVIFLAVLLVSLITTDVAADEVQIVEEEDLLFYEEESPPKGEESAALQAFNKGIELFRRSEYEKAAHSFLEAHRLKPSWKLFFNIGQCYAATKRYGLAIEAFERYLGEGGDYVPEDRHATVLNELDNLRRVVGNVKIVGKKPGVKIFIDDVLRGETPLTKQILVTAGVEHSFVFVEDDKEILSINSSVNGGVTLELAIPVDEEEEEEEDEPAAQPVEDASRGIVEQDKGISPVGFGICLGATVVFAGTAVVMDVLVKNKYEEAEQNTLNPNLNDLKSEGKSIQTVGYVAFGLAIAAGITTGILIPFTDFGRDENDDVALSMNPWGDEHGGGLSVQGRF